MNLHWTELAAERLRQLQEHISKDNPRAALRQAECIINSAEQLIHFPRSGRIGRVKGTREIVVPQTPYIVAYRINGDLIEVLAIEHGARKWPDHF